MRISYVNNLRLNPVFKAFIVPDNLTNGFIRTLKHVHDRPPLRTLHCHICYVLPISHFFSSVNVLVKRLQLRISVVISSPSIVATASSLWMSFHFLFLMICSNAIASIISVTFGLIPKETPLNFNYILLYELQ